MSSLLSLFFCRTIATVSCVGLVFDVFSFFKYDFLNNFKIESSKIRTKYNLVTSNVNVVIAFQFQLCAAMIPRWLRFVILIKDVALVPLFSVFSRRGNSIKYIKSFHIFHSRSYLVLSVLLRPVCCRNLFFKIFSYRSKILYRFL